MPVLERLSILTGYVASIAKSPQTVEDKLSKSPEFKRLATSNEPPSPVERRAIRLLLRQGYIDLRDLESRVRAAYGHDCDYTTLQTRRNTLESCIDAHKKIIAPIRRLPAQILSMIFALCNTGKNIFDSTQFPLLPLFVCRRWNEVARNDASLWTHIIMAVPDMYRAGCNRRLVKHLEYSRVTFLHITIESDSWMPVHPDEWVEKEAFQSLIYCARRWRTINLPLTCNGGPAIRGIQGKLDSLRIATLGLPKRMDSMRDWAPRYVLDAFDFAPRLHTLTIQNYLPISHFSLPRLPRSAKYKHPLRSFSTAEHLDAPNMREIFQQLPNIQTFQTTLSPPLIGSPDHPSLALSIPAANLSHLILHQVDSLCLGNRCTLDALAASDLPRLHTLTMPLTEKYADNLQRFILKARKSLRVIELHPRPHFEDSSISGAAVVKALSAAEYLKELYIFEEKGATLVVPMLLNLLNMPDEMTGEARLVYLDVAFLISDHPRSQESFLHFLHARCMNRPEFGPPIPGGYNNQVVRPRITPGKVSRVGMGFTEHVEAETQASVVRSIRGLNVIGVAARAGMYVRGEKGMNGKPKLIDVSGSEEYLPSRTTEMDEHDLGSYL